MVFHCALLDKINSYSFLKRSVIKSDTVTWDSFQKGDREAFEAIVRSYSRLLFNYGTRFTQDRELIKECIQDLFVSIWERRNHLNRVEHIKHYLFKAFRINLLKQINLGSKFVSADNLSLFEITFNKEAQMIITEHQLDIKQKLEAALKKLSARQYEAVYLRYYEGLSFEEISGIMNISAKGTYKLMGRAIAVMRQNLKLKDFRFILLGLT